LSDPSDGVLTNRARPTKMRYGDDHMVSDKRELLNLDIDLRIGVDAWAEVWAGTFQRSDELLFALLRFAYGRGYHDALTEPVRGKLCRDHGFPVPSRRG
jgi:hypothetical protein